MRLEIFLRRKVICETTRLKEVITNWLAVSGWKFKDFSKFLELIGLKTPIRLSGLEENKNRESSTYYFHCITADKANIKMAIRHPNIFKDHSQILITEKNNTKEFGISSKNKGSLPQVLLENSVIKKQERELTTVYLYWGWNYFKSELKFDENHFLEIKINEPIHQKEIFQRVIQEKWKEFENYMINLERWNLIVTEVYRNILRIFSGLRIEEETTVKYTEKGINDEQIQYYRVKRF